MARNNIFRIACSLWLIILCGLTIGPPPLTAQNDSAWLYGIHWYADPDPDNGGSVETMTGGKGIWLLETLMTEDKNPAPWAWGLEAQLDKFTRARDRGHTLIIRIQPSWEMVVPGPGEMESFLVDVAATARSLADIAHIWQIGNEMQLEGGKYWNRTGEELTAELYVKKYKQIRNAITSVSSSLGPQIVLLGPVAAGNTDYLGAMCDELTADDVDGFAIHAYGGSHGSLMQQIADQTTLIDRKGFAQKPIYMTEWGDRVDSALSPTSIENVANFLRHSFWELSVYNSDPLNHPIVCACWFVYQRSDQWKRWSILGLHDRAGAGELYDLYQAFNDASGENYPAGNDFMDGNPEGLFIRHSPVALNPITIIGQNAPNDEFSVYQAGIGALRYTIADDANWLLLAPENGTSTGERDTITVTYNTAGLQAGQHPATITISDPQATNNPRTIQVDLTVLPDVPAPTISNPDFEADGGGFGVARGWNNFGGNKWESVWDPQHVYSQGVSEIPAAGQCGIYQTISVSPGTHYRVAMSALSQTPDYEVAIGVDLNGSNNPNAAMFGVVSSSGAWSRLTHHFIATGYSATIFLRGHNKAPRELMGKWCLFDDVTIEVLGSGNAPPFAVISANPKFGDSPLEVHFDATGSGDPDSDPLSYQWDFGDESPLNFDVTAAHTYNADGIYEVNLTVDDGNGATDTTSVTITVGATPDLLVNADFSDGLIGWTVWTERGMFDQPLVNSDQLHLRSSNHNGGVYQQFETGGAGTLITVNGFWATDPTLPENQWAEVLIINSDRLPVNWNDIHAGQGDVVLIYKNDTWHSDAVNGWNGLMNDTAVVANSGSFEAQGDVATIVLKSGNMGGAVTGTRFDDIIVAVESTPPDPGNRDPDAVASATPTKGEPPLRVDFDGSGSSDPDGDGLTFAWDFGDGSQGSGISVSYTYNAAGIYQAALSVDDGNGGVDTDALYIQVGQSGVSDKSKLTIHTSFLGPTSWWFLEQAQPTVIKILDELKPEITQAVKDKSPRTRIVGRIWYDAWQRLGDGSPEDRAQEWWDDVKGTILANPAVDYWEGYNEPVVHHADIMEWYARFEKRRVEILAAHDRKACIGNFSTGMPPVELDVWEAFYPAIDAAMAHGGVMGLHEYSARDMDWLFDYGSGEGWLTGRYRKVYRQFLSPTNREIQLVITECGIDGGVLGEPEEINHGWRSYQSPESYFEQLQWYDSLLKADDYVLGATIFSLEIHNWGDFDISGRVSELLTDYVKSSGR